MGYNYCDCTHWVYFENGNTINKIVIVKPKLIEVMKNVHRCERCLKYKEVKTVGCAAH